MNSQYFTEEQVKNGSLQKLLDFLMSEAYDNSGHYNDIHIFPVDCGAFTVEWVQLPWSHDYGGRGFEYVDDDHVVMLEKEFPDGSIAQFFDDEDYEAILEDWLKDNPGWKKNDYGHWYNEIENQNIAKLFGLDKITDDHTPCYDDPSDPLDVDELDADDYDYDDDYDDDITDDHDSASPESHDN